MTSQPLLLVAVVVVLVLLSWFFVAAETAFSGLSRVRLQELRDSGNRRAGRLDQRRPQGTSDWSGDTQHRRRHQFGQRQRLGGKLMRPSCSNSGRGRASIDHIATAAGRTIPDL